MAGAEDTIGASCPGGGSFYVCETSGFIGCCRSDPCQSDSGLCGDDDLRPMSFDTDKYNDILAQDCQTSASGVHWYVCTGTQPFPFMGCCAVNPCAEGECPSQDLRESKLSSNDRNAQVFLGDDSSSSTTVSSSSSSTSTATSTTSETSAATTSSSSESSSGDSGGLSQGAIIGIAVGASVLGLAAVGIFFFWCWRRAKRSRDAADASKGPLMGYGHGPHDSKQYPDMQYQSQYSPNTASFGIQSPHSAAFTHPNSPQPYHDRGSYHPAMSPPLPGMHSPQPGYQWAGSPPPDQQAFLNPGGMYNQQSPPAHVTSFHNGAQENGPVELPASMTQQSSDVSTMSELPANPNTLSVQSYSGVTGRESEVSRMTASELGNTERS